MYQLAQVKMLLDVGLFMLTPHGYLHHEGLYISLSRTGCTLKLTLNMLWAIFAFDVSYMLCISLHESISFIISPANFCVSAFLL